MENLSNVPEEETWHATYVTINAIQRDLKNGKLNPDEHRFEFNKNRVNYVNTTTQAVLYSGFCYECVLEMGKMLGIPFFWVGGYDFIPGMTVDEAKEDFMRRFHENARQS